VGQQHRQKDGQLKHCNLSDSKQCRIYGVIGDEVGYPKNFNDKIIPTLLYIKIILKKPFHFFYHAIFP